MSYTNIELVRKHFGYTDVPVGHRYNQPLLFHNLNALPLPGGRPVEGTVTIKAIHDYSPFHEKFVAEGSEISLAHGNPVPDSIVVASDNSLGSVFRENIDYSLDYVAGRLRLSGEGAIVSGSNLDIWYYYYTVYEEGCDFQVDYREGTIRILPGGRIQVNRTVLADYEIGGVQLPDEIMDEAILEADGIIERMIDPGKQAGADRLLQTAATYLAVSIACRMAAVRDLGSDLATRTTADAWMAIADSYRRDYEALLGNFKPKTAGFNYPTH